MSLSHEIRRFNWIRIYCDAMRWALVNELTAGHYARIATFQTLIETEGQWWLERLTRDEELRHWLAHKRGRGCYWSPEMRHDFFYLYDLEAELWGANFAHFLDCTVEHKDTGLEPFRLVLLFYLVERSLKLLLGHLRFLNYDEPKHSHAHIRETAYTHLFGRTHLARWVPFPYNLTALSKRLVHGHDDTLRHLRYGFAGTFTIVGKTHYVQVLESTLCQAVTWQRERHTQRGQRPPRGKLHAFFFDPLWRYSESYRYRLPLADEYVRNNPYYWGLNLRWLGSALIGLVELWLYTLSARHLREVWSSYARQSRAAALPVVQLPRWHAIRDQQPQLLV